MSDLRGRVEIYMSVKRMGTYWSTRSRALNSCLVLFMIVVTQRNRPGFKVLTGFYVMIAKI